MAESGGAMSSVNPVRRLQDEATCSICLEYYKDPVTTQCGHNFCRSCIAQYSQGADKALPCPQCRVMCPLGDLRPNRQLQCIIELVQQLSVQPERPREEEETLCEEHEEQLKLFCKEDEKLICLVCRESSDHKLHSVLPTEEAVMQYKVELQVRLQLLRKEMQRFLESKHKEEEDYRTMRDMLESERLKIVAEFEKLRQLLKDEEQTLLRSLREMDEKIAVAENANIAKLSGQMSSLKALITEIEKKCEQPAAELLKDIRSTLSRCQDAAFLAPEGIGAKLQKYKVRVTLDPDTAHQYLTLSEDGRRVTWMYTAQPLPDNPKRFTDSASVLGREGFSSGRHYWELQLLQEGGGWAVGVARESVKEGAQSPEGVVWAVQRWNDGHYWALTSPQSPLSPSQSPSQVGLYLDYEGGRLSVYNADTMEEIYTFTGAAFTGSIYPYFWVGGWIEAWTDLRLL